MRVAIFLTEKLRPFFPSIIFLASAQFVHTLPGDQVTELEA
jgi:hypothetical protein